MPKQHGEDPSITALVKNIDNDPDRLHADVTPSVLKLVDLGVPGAKAVLGLLDAPEFLTRKRAQRVVEGVAMRHYGWVAGRGYPSQEAQNKVQTAITRNGNYQADDPPKKRKEAIQKWRLWLKEQQK